MSAQTRTVLKGYFEAGDTPTATEFGDQVDTIFDGDKSSATVLATGATTARQLAARSAEQFTPQDFGAVADGVTDDTTAIQAAVVAAEARKGLVVIPGTTSYYKLSGPILVRGPVTIIGDGDGSLFWNEAADSPVSQSNVFLFGNHHPTLLEQVTDFACSTITAGKDVVTSATATGIAVNDPVWIKSTANHVDGTGNTIRAFYQLNVVTGLVGNDYTMLHPIDEDVASPLMQPANTSEIQGLLGNDLFVAQNVEVSNIAARSTFGRAVSRGGALNCSFHFTTIRGLDGFFGNGWNHCKWTVDRMIVSRKIQDSAMGAANNKVFIGRADYIDTGETSVAQILFGESSRDNDVCYGLVNLTDKAFTNPVALFAFARRNRLRINTLIAEGHSSVVVNYVNAVESPNQPLTHDNVMEFGTVLGGASLERFANFDDSGGECKRNQLVSGDFSGTPSAFAVTLDGEDNYIGPACNFRGGGLDIQAGATGCRVFGRFQDWIGQIITDAHLQNEIRIWSDKQQNAKTHSVLVNEVNNINTTVANTIQYTTGTIPANTLAVIGNLRPTIKIRVKGTVNGTTDTKFIAVADDTGVLNTFTIAAGTSGAFQLEADLIMMSNSRYDYWADLDGTRPAMVARTSLDLVLNTRKIDLQAWVTNASDSISFRETAIVIETNTNPEFSPH